MKSYVVGIYSHHVLKMLIPHLSSGSVPADCGDPSLPVNGFVMAYDSTLEGSQIVFQCNPGLVHHSR